MSQAAPDAAPGAGGTGGELPIAQDLLDLLVCPVGRAPLRLQGDWLVCTRCGLSYHIEDGIPNMIVEDARLPEGVTRVEDLACYPRG